MVGHREEDFTLDLDHARALVVEQRPSVVLLPSPNNPTGTALPPEAVTALCEAAGDGLVVVDEAYGEFRRDGHARARSSCCRAHRNLVVTRTMSKAFALAGARLGYLAADPAICDAIRVVRLPYHLSAVTQAIALAALRHAPELLGEGRRPAGRARRAPSPGCASRASRSPTATPTSCCSGASGTGTPSGRGCWTAAC